MKVEIWSDVACPWCYVGKRRFESALERFAHRDRVEVEWKSFELDPGARTRPADSGGDYADRLGRKYGKSRDEAQQMLDTMTATGATERLDIHFEKVVQANTFDAHQLIHLGREHGVQDAVKELLLRAYFTDGDAVADRDVLVRVGVDAGLDADEVRTALDDQRFADAVRSDEAEASALGISGVPFFVLDRKFGISGAQPAEAILAGLEQAWAAANPLTMVAASGESADGHTCGTDGCPV